MITFLKIAGLALLTVIAIVLIYAATRPDQFRITRKVIIKAPAEVIFAHINNLRQFNEWNPFAAADLRSSIPYGATSAGGGRQLQLGRPRPVKQGTHGNHRRGRAAPRRDEPSF